VNLSNVLLVQFPNFSLSFSLLFQWLQLLLVQSYISGSTFAVSQYTNSCILTSFPLPFAQHFCLRVLPHLSAWMFSLYYYHHHHHDLSADYLQLYTWNKNVSTVRNVAAVMYLQFVLHVMLFRRCTFALAFPAVSVLRSIWQFFAVPNFRASLFCCSAIVWVILKLLLLLLLMYEKEQLKHTFHAATCRYFALSNKYERSLGDDRNTGFTKLCLTIQRSCEAWEIWKCQCCYRGRHVILTTVNFKLHVRGVLT